MWENGTKFLKVLSICINTILMQIITYFIQQPQKQITKKMSDEVIMCQTKLEINQSFKVSITYMDAVPLWFIIRPH